jgi:hypothetical protein
MSEWLPLGGRDVSVTLGDSDVVTLRSSDRLNQSIDRIESVLNTYAVMHSSTPQHFIHVVQVFNGQGLSIVTSVFVLSGSLSVYTLPRA